MKDIQLGAEAIKTFPFLDSKMVLDGLKQELPTYLVKVVDLDPAIDILHWWHCNKSDLPSWAVDIHKTLFVQPSTAVTEQVFLLLKSSFNSQQQSSL